MDWKLALSTFATLFLAEMGDKTQLATITLTASSGRPLTVFAAAAAALVAVTAIGVVLGEAVTRWVSPSMLRRGAALLFIAIGVWTWFRE